MNLPTTTTQMKIGMTFPTRIAVYDCETTAPDPREARLVSAFAGIMDTATGEFIERHHWLVNPGVEIPAGAAAVHGITTERARRDGMDPKEASYQILQRLNIYDRESLAIVIMNAPYDVTVLDREIERHWGPSMRPLVEGDWVFDGNPWDGPEAQPWAVPGVTWKTRNSPVFFDPMVLDRAFDKYRKGSRKLVDLCRVYGVPVETNAHDAEADCRMAGRLAVKLMGHSRLQDLSLCEVHDKTIPTKFDQAMDLARYWQDKKLPRVTSNDERIQLLRQIVDVKTRGHFWPLIPRGI